MTQYKENREPFYDPREDDFAADLQHLELADPFTASYGTSLAKLPKFFDPRVKEDLPITLAKIQNNYVRSALILRSQQIYEFPRSYRPSAGTSVLRDKPMSQAKRLALALLEQEVLEFEDDTRPDYCDGPEVHAAWRTKVRTQMAHRIRELLRRVSVSRTKTMTDPEGNTVKATKRYSMRTALVKLRALRYHRAFQRTQACAEHWTYKSRQCNCPTDTQRRLRKSITEMAKHDRPWVLLTVYLTYQGYVQHYYDFLQPVVGKDGHENGDRRVWEGDRRDDEKVTRWHTEVDEHGVEHEVAGETEMVTVVDGGKTRFLDSFNLQGWDRPSSWPTKTTRLAFCPTCKALGSPWFRVPLKRVDGRYERPAGEVAKCPTCGSDEGTPEPRTEAITYTARQRFVRKGQPVIREEVFERRNGRWFYGSTGEVCHVLLSNEIERRWRKRPAPETRKVTGKVLPQPKTEPEDGSKTFTLEGRRAWYRTLDLPTQRASHAPVEHAPRKLGSLVAFRTEEIKPWQPSRALLRECAQPVREVVPEVVPEPVVEVPPAPLPTGTFRLILKDGHLVDPVENVWHELPSYEEGALYYGDELGDPIMTGREYLLDLIAKYDAK